MANTLIIRRRIRSIRSTRQITKAMELVAATKMHRTQIQAQASRTYALLAWEMLNSLAHRVEKKFHRLLRVPREVKKAAVVLLTSNRGLAGSFNGQIISRTLSYIQELKKQNKEISIEILTCGRKGREALVKAGQKVVADFPKIDVAVRVEDIQSISAMLVENFLNEEYDQVVLSYMDFISTISQKPRIKQILPFPRLEAARNLAESDELGKFGLESVADQKKMEGEGSDCLFEPTADVVLAKLLPRLLEMQIYQAVLESNASEHSARMVAMKNASDAAADLIDELTLEYNQMRQEGITLEIAEISAGRLAVT